MKEGAVHASMMRVAVRETGSVTVPAAKDEVMELLRHTLQGAAQTAPDRIRAAESTYVVRETENGTQIILARREDLPVPLGNGPRSQLRRGVESDLFRLQRLFDVKSRGP